MSQIENDLKLEIIKSVKKSFDLDIEMNDVIIELPKDVSHGDYASNIAMQLARTLKRKPKEIAESICSNLNLDIISSYEIAGPGFINIFLKNEYLAEVINLVLDQDEKYGHNNTGNGLKINIEYVSANPTGDLHPGHARGAALGDSVSRLLKMSGYDVTREYYVNDAGNQINNMALSLRARYFQEFNYDVEVPEDGYHGSDLIDIAKDLVSKVNDKYINYDEEEALIEFKKFGLEAELNKIKADLKAFNCEFDVFFSEQYIRDNKFVEKALNQLKDRGYTYEKDNALWLKTTSFNDDKDRVIVKSDGSYTYLTPDIAYHLNKLDRGYDKLVDVLGADHHSYVVRLKAAIQALGYEQDKLEVDIVQMARMIKDGEEFKLSKRSGKAVALIDLLDEVGSDALRYFFISRAADTQMDFDLDMAIKRSNENPVYYAQYAHARMCSILNSAKDIDISRKFNLISNEKELTLIKHINEFPKVVADAAYTRMPHKLCNYISKLAQYFHSFYGECKVLDYDNIPLSTQRLALVKASKITLKNALNSIGVSAPESM
ncbi:MAG: arginine--tRNA ligase [Erysipelotrichaceae bacterium]|nr:arginine--tRNA ligase [Erysipelotrichaceae bacterium]